MSATIARSRGSVDSASRRSIVSQRGTRGSRALRRGLVRRSRGFRSSFTLRTAHLAKLPSVASRTRMVLAFKPRAASAYWYARHLSGGEVDDEHRASDLPHGERFK